MGQFQKKSGEARCKVLAWGLLAGVAHPCPSIHGVPGHAILNSTILHNVFLPDAGTGGKTCPCRAMMATSDPVRRFRLPVPGCRLGLYDCRPGRSPGFLVAARMLPGRCPGLHAKRVQVPAATLRRAGRLNVARRRPSLSRFPVPWPCCRRSCCRPRFPLPVPGLRRCISPIVHRNS